MGGRRCALFYGLRIFAEGLQRRGRRDCFRCPGPCRGPAFGAAADDRSDTRRAGRIHRAGHARSGRRGAFHLPRRRRDQGALRPLSRPGRKVAGDPRRPESPRSRGLQRRGGLERALPARRHRPRLYLHPVAAACADGGLRHGARQARGRGGSRRHVARRVLAAGQYRRKDPAPLHDARKLRLRLFRADDAQYGPARAVRRDHPHRRFVHSRPRSVLGALSGQLASRLQPVAPR